MGLVDQAGKPSVPSNRRHQRLCTADARGKTGASVFGTRESYPAESGARSAPRCAAPQRAVWVPVCARSREWVEMAKARMPALVRTEARRARIAGEMKQRAGLPDRTPPLRSATAGSVTERPQEPAAGVIPSQHATFSARGLRSAIIACAGSSSDIRALPKWRRHREKIEAFADR